MDDSIASMCAWIARSNNPPARIGRVSQLISLENADNTVPQNFVSVKRNRQNAHAVFERGHLDLE